MRRVIAIACFLAGLFPAVAFASGGGEGGASASLLLQAVMTMAMTTMAMAERPARSDASK